jgi:hypothetical protein
VRIWPGQESAMHQVAAGRALEDLAFGVDQLGLTPKKGQRRRAGLQRVAPGSGVIMMPPVSVCHQVSTIGQRPSPTTR